jgi:hypothetical protein
MRDGCTVAIFRDYLDAGKGKSRKVVRGCREKRGNQFRCRSQFNIGLEQVQGYEGKCMYSRENPLLGIRT